MTEEVTPVELTKEDFDAAMNVVAPVCLDVIRTMVALPQSWGCLLLSS